jgi:hypothetical protein
VVGKLCQNCGEPIYSPEFEREIESGPKTTKTVADRTGDVQRVTCPHWSALFKFPITAERFEALVEERMRFTGASVAAASRSLIVALSEQDLDRLSEKLMQRASGGDPVKIAELKHRAALVAGLPMDAEFEAV